MLKNIRTYLNEGTLYYGLEITEYLDNISFHLLEVQRKKEELVITREESFSDLGNIPQTLKKDAPLFLTINTDKILVKVQDTNTTENYETLVYSSFPNLDFETFYYEVSQMEKNTLTTISKKEHIDGYLKKLVELKVNVVGFSLGISKIPFILPYVNSNTLNISNKRLTLETNSVHTVSSLSESEKLEHSAYDINGLKITTPHILNFSGVFTYLSKSRSTASNFENNNDTLNQEFKNKRYFNLLLKSSLFFILGLLLINFFIFNHYFQKVEDLETTSALNSTNKERLSKLKSIVQKKEERVTMLLVSGNSKSTFFLDQIAQDIPNTILLNGLEYQPLTKPMRESKPIELHKKNILVNGTATNSSDFSIWIENLERLQWVKNVETLDYDYSTRNMSAFSVKITINE